MTDETLPTTPPEKKPADTETPPAGPPPGGGVTKPPSDFDSDDGDAMDAYMADSAFRKWKRDQEEKEKRERLFKKYPHLSSWTIARLELLNSFSRTPNYGEENDAIAEWYNNASRKEKRDFQDKEDAERRATRPNDRQKPKERDYGR